MEYKTANDEVLSEIIDIDTNYVEDESTGPSAKQKNSGDDEKRKILENDDEEFNPVLL